MNNFQKNLIKIKPHKNYKKEALYENIPLNNSNSKMKKILLNYLNRENDLENQALRNSFGKMVSTRNITNPRYSFGKEERFPSLINKRSITSILPLDYNNKNNFYENNIINNNKSKNNISKTIPNNDNYTITSLKYSRSPKWAFSKSERDNYIKNNKYDYYDYPIDSISQNNNKKWDSRIIGGDIGIEERFNEFKNYCNEASRPGPGGYNPAYSLYKYKKNNYGYMGIKPEIKKEKDVYDKRSFYEVNCQIGSNVNNYKFVNSPSYVFGTSKRDLEKKKNRSKINDRYLKYSSFGEQIMTQKNSRPNYSFGKQERFNKF